MIREKLDIICRKTFDDVLRLFYNVRRIKISVVVFYGENERYSTDYIFNCKSLKK